MKPVLTILLLLFKLIAFAQTNYDVALISTPIKNRANAIVRNEETVVNMLATDNVVYTVKKAVTIFNKMGEKNAELVIFYNKSINIKSIKGEIYNQTGNLIGKFNQNNFIDESAVSNFSIYEDDRVKHYLPYANEYPYTVVFDYEIRYKQNLIIPTWTPKPTNDLAVEKSSFKFICKPEDEFRINANNYNGKAEELLEKEQKALVWNVNNLPATKNEQYAPKKSTYQTSIKIAPKNFQYYNYKGSYTNWQELGKWQYDNLLNGRDILPPATVNFIKGLVKNETSDKEKAKKIYQYLQNKTRYISVQIGIGGFQPFKAADVDRLGYGDCKALVNYMQSLLAIANIPSYYCIVNAGDEKESLNTNFATMDQANHVILCMPLKGDTTWLECTSQKAPFGYLGTFTDDRYGLACTKDGGKILKTPKLANNKNTQIRNAQLTFSNDGDITGTLTTDFNGSQFENYNYITDKPFIEQEKLLKTIYDIDNIDFDKIDYKKIMDEEPKLEEKLNIHIRKYGTLNNDKLYFIANAFNVKNTISESRTRTLPVEIERGYMDIDTITYILSENIDPSNIPLSKNTTTKFGYYQAGVTLEGNKITYARKFVLNEGKYPPADYVAFTAFINEVSKNDRLKLIFNLKK